jgi:hypothetical protein
MFFSPKREVGHSGRTALQSTSAFGFNRAAIALSRSARTAWLGIHSFAKARAARTRRVGT